MRGKRPRPRPRATHRPDGGRQRGRRGAARSDTDFGQLGLGDTADRGTSRARWATTCPPSTSVPDGPPRRSAPAPPHLRAPRRRDGQVLGPRPSRTAGSRRHLQPRRLRRARWYDLPTIDLGAGRTATAVSTGGEVIVDQDTTTEGHTCVLLDDAGVKCWVRAPAGSSARATRPTVVTRRASWATTSRRSTLAPTPTIPRSRSPRHPTTPPTARTRSSTPTTRCTDDTGGSGIDTCNGDVADGDPIDTTTLGDHTFTVTATDHAGNDATATHALHRHRRPPTPTHHPTAPTRRRHLHPGQRSTADYSCADERAAPASTPAPATSPTATPSTPRSRRPHLHRHRHRPRRQRDHLTHTTPSPPRRAPASPVRHAGLGEHATGGRRHPRHARSRRPRRGARRP